MSAEAFTRKSAIIGGGHSGLHVRRVRLTPPALLPDAFALPPVAGRLARAPGYPVTLVTAPAGFGKTTQLSLWFRDLSAAAWISLAAEDDDPALLFRLIVAAIGGQHLDLARRLDHLVATGADNPRLLGEAVADVLADLPSDFVLVLDDVHDLASPRTLGVLDHLLRHPPPRLHLVLAGRADPAIPALDRLDQRGRVHRIDEAQLRFTASDALHFLPEELPRRDEVAQSITLRAEGWPAGVRSFATLHSAPGEDAVPSGGAPASLRRFVAGEVLARQPAAAVDLLRATATLPHLTPALVAAMHGGMTEAGARRLLDGLVAARAFIAPDGRGGYRVHAVMRETLQEHLGPDAVAEQHADAAEWFARRGQVAEAAAHAFAAGNDFAANLLERHLSTWLLRQHWGEIAAAIGRLPDDVVQTRPALMLALANTLVTRGLGEQAQRMVSTAEALLDQRERDGSDPDADGARRLRWEAQALRVLAAQFTGNISASVDLALPVIGAADASIKARADAISAWAFGMAELGRLDEAEQTLGGIAAGDPEAKLRIAALLGLMVIAIYRLDVTQLESRARLTLAEAEPHGFPRELAWGHFILAFVAYERNDLATAGMHAAAGHDLAAGAFITAAQQFAILRAKIAAASGQPAEALAVADADCRGLHLVGALPLMPVASTLRARYAAALGDMAALDGPRPIGLLDTQLAQSQPIGSPAFFWAAALLERNRPGDASRAADLLEAFRATPAARHPWRLAEALPLLAAAREAMGDRAAAMAIMAETLAQEPGVLVRRFADAGPFSLAVLRRLAASDDPLAERAARVLDAISPPATDPGPLSTLTSREREVLELMGHWLTNKEIATRLGISPNTVRQHSVSIFRKLGVEDRRDAVDVLLATRRPMLRQRADHTVPGNP